MLHYQFIKNAKKYARKTAYIDKNINKSFTYKKALAASLVLKNRFKKYNGDLIGVMLPNSFISSVVFVSILMCGKTPVVINYTMKSEKNISVAKEKCKFDVIITSRVLLEKIKCPEIKPMVFIEDVILDVKPSEKLKSFLTSLLPSAFIIKLCDYKNVLNGDGGENGKRKDDNKDAVILFTTGSEKEPKAVRLSHKNIISNINDLKFLFNLSEKDIMLSVLPIFHIFGLTTNTCLPFYIGMSSVIYANPLDFKTVVSIIKENSPSIIATTPFFLTGYLRKSEKGDFQSLRYIVSGGDKCHEHIHTEFAEKHDKRIYEGYGTTETSPVISVNTVNNYRLGSVGKPLPAVKVKIVHHETGLTLKPCETGKIMVSGDTVMKGYFGDHDLTRKCMFDGFYDTGDMGYIDEDGFLWHAGRLKRFVKIASEMVSLEHVEYVLEKCFSENIEFCVVGVENGIKGVKLLAVTSGLVEESSICKKAKEYLPNLCIPKEFIVVGELPRLFNGKIDFKKVEEMIYSLVLRS